MMRINIRTIFHGRQRYNTVGDYYVDKNGTREILVSDKLPDDYVFLIAIHELIEQHLCLKRGIPEEGITAFDKMFEQERHEGKWTIEEPGFDVRSPYKKEHEFATLIEEMISSELGVDWQEYNKAVSEL